MKITIFNRDGEVTKPMKEIVIKKCKSLESFPLVIKDDTEIKFEVEHKKNNKFKVEGTIISNKETLHAKVYGLDYYELVGECVDKLTRQARKVKTKVIKHQFERVIILMAYSQKGGEYNGIFYSSISS